MGLLFLANSGNAQILDSTVKEAAIRKMKMFSILLKHLAGPDLDLTTKAKIERKLETDFIDNEEVRFYQDLNFQFGRAQQIAVPQYFTQLKVLYPNGASLETSDFEVSDFYYNQARDMYYLNFRCFRDFTGLNVLAKKQVKVSKTIDYQVKIIEAGLFKIEIVSGFLSEGELEVPHGLDKAASEIGKKEISILNQLESEQMQIHSSEVLLEEINTKKAHFETLAEAQKKKIELNYKETKSEKKERKVKEHLEKQRLKKELAKAKEERKSLYYPKINIRLGAGLFITDSSFNSMIETNTNFITENWMGKLDVLYKFSGMERQNNGQWGKGHAFGIFMNYGKQTYRNLNRFMDPNIKLDTARPGRGFFEVESGFMLREELRLSGGMGLMHYNQNKDGQESNASKPYFLATVGISPRLRSFLEMDLNLSWLLINNKIYPRANVNLIILIKCKR